MYVVRVKNRPLPEIRMCTCTHSHTGTSGYIESGCSERPCYQMEFICQISFHKWFHTSKQRQRPCKKWNETNYPASTPFAVATCTCGSVIWSVIQLTCTVSDGLIVVNHSCFPRLARQDLTKNLQVNTKRSTGKKRFALFEPPTLIYGAPEELDVGDEYHWVDGVVCYPTNPGEEALHEPSKWAESCTNPYDIAWVFGEGSRELSSNQGFRDAPNYRKNHES